MFCIKLHKLFPFFVFSHAYIILLLTLLLKWSVFKLYSWLKRKKTRKKKINSNKQPSCLYMINHVESIFSHNLLLFFAANIYFFFVVFVFRIIYFICKFHCDNPPDMELLELYCCCCYLFVWEEYDEVYMSKSENLNHHKLLLDKKN